MIKSGTTCFNDGYFFSHSTARAVEEMGMRAVLAEAIFDFFDKEKSQSAKTKILQYFENSKKYSDRLHFALGPHATYTVSTELLQWIHHFALSNNLLIHLHLAESRTEHKETIARFGLSPVRYLKKAGLLSPHLIIAHGLWLDKEEIKMLADNDVRVIHNPNSNLKLASGYRFKYEEMKMAGITVGIGTDGCASSNNLDMIEAMKTASLLQKTWRYNPTIMPAQEALHCATLNGAKILRLNAGKIESGCLADLCLIDLNTTAFTPNFDFVSNLVYAAHSDCVDTVICNGKILMENRHIPEEQTILHKTTEIAHRLIKK
jgi:5-methylthioadenosine/S-adenosylhomocysteine deaminase